MTLTQIQKMRRQSGVTLVELLVVMLIVAILAIGLLPIFQRFVIRSQYTADAIPLVGHIRTQLGLYYYEKGHLPAPVTGDSFTPEIYTISTNLNNASFTVVKNANVGQGPNAADTVVTGTDNYLANLDIAFTELQGTHVQPQHVEFAVIENADSYGYAIGVFGDGTSLPGNSGYAFCELYFANVKLGAAGSSGGNGGGDGSQTAAGTSQDGYKFTATWTKYTQGTTRFHFKTNGNGEGFVQLPGSLSQGTVAEVLAPFTGGNSGIGRWEFPPIPDNAASQNNGGTTSSGGGGDDTPPAGG